MYNTLSQSPSPLSSGARKDRYVRMCMIHGANRHETAEFRVRHVAGRTGWGNCGCLAVWTGLLPV